MFYYFKFVTAPAMDSLKSVNKVYYYYYYYHFNLHGDLEVEIYGD